MYKYALFMHIEQPSALQSNEFGLAIDRTGR
jgi:hypothetical protein